MEDQQIWKDVLDYEEYYEVSNLGNVRSKKTNKYLKLSNKNNYYIIALCKPNEKRKLFRVHRLVATAFIPNPDNKAEVNHIDKNKLNNNVNNLNWMSHQENCAHRSYGVKISNNRNIPIQNIDINTNLVINNYNSMEEAAKWLINNNFITSFNCAKSYLCNAVKNNSILFGFKWKKIEQIINNNEIWKEIIIDNNPTGHYVSSLGRYKNIKGIIMENYKVHNSGYLYAKINNKKYAIHRLVAFSFLENLENKPSVYHIDGNKINNNINNLLWATENEINEYNFKMGYVNCFTKHIVKYDLKMNKLHVFSSIKEASTVCNISSSNISSCLNNRQKLLESLFGNI